MGKSEIIPALKQTFDKVCEIILSQENKQSGALETTGDPGKQFVASIETTGDGRTYISLPHSNRIYKEDWGYRNNSMGEKGQRIGQYSIPIDNWVTNIVKAK